jgi:hypothetical protein
MVCDPTIGVLSAALVRKRVEASADDPYTMRTEIQVARIGADGTPESVSYCENVSIHDPLAEVRQRAMAKECDDVESERQRIESVRTADELQRIADSRQVPDTRPGHYYVSATDRGTHWFAMVGPLATHQEALDLVDDVRKYANEVDCRSVWYNFGTCRVDLSEVPPTGKISLQMLAEARQRWSEGIDTAPHKVSAKRKRSVDAVDRSSVADGVLLRKLSDLPNRDR